jgi:hypothetical protein
VLGIEPVLEKYPALYFDLEIYPNPVRNVAAIAVKIPHESQAVLELFNLQGKPVMQVFTRHFHQGVYRMEYSFDSLPAGVYIARLADHDHVRSRKIIVTN